MARGAVGTHYLTCPGLRLPSGYRFGDDPEPGRLVARALARRDERER